MARYDQKFSIRKVTVGAASVVIGLAAGSAVANAADVETQPAHVQNVESANLGESVDLEKILKKAQPVANNAQGEKEAQEGKEATAAAVQEENNKVNAAQDEKVAEATETATDVDKKEDAVDKNLATDKKDENLEGKVEGYSALRSVASAREANENAAERNEEADQPKEDEPSQAEKELAERKNKVLERINSAIYYNSENYELDENTKKELIEKLESATNDSELNSVISSLEDAKKILTDKKDIENRLDNNFPSLTAENKNILLERVKNEKQDYNIYFIKNRLLNFLDRVEHSKIDNKDYYISKAVKAEGYNEISGLESELSWQLESNRDLEREREQYLSSIREYISNLNLLSKDKKEYYYEKLKNKEVITSEDIDNVKKEAFDENKVQVDKLLAKEKENFDLRVDSLLYLDEKERELLKKERDEVYAEVYKNEENYIRYREYTSDRLDRNDGRVGSSWVEQYLLTKIDYLSDLNVLKLRDDINVDIIKNELLDYRYTREGYEDYYYGENNPKWRELNKNYRYVKEVLNLGNVPKEFKQVLVNNLEYVIKLDDFSYRFETDGINNGGNIIKPEALSPNNRSEFTSLARIVQAILNSTKAEDQKKLESLINQRPEKAVFFEELTNIEKRQKEDYNEKRLKELKAEIESYNIPQEKKEEVQNVLAENPDRALYLAQLYSIDNLTKEDLAVLSKANEKNLEKAKVLSKLYKVEGLSEYELKSTRLEILKDRYSTGPDGSDVVDRLKSEKEKVTSFKELKEKLISLSVDESKIKSLENIFNDGRIYGVNAKTLLNIVNTLENQNNLSKEEKIRLLDLEIGYESKRYGTLFSAGLLEQLDKYYFNKKKVANSNFSDSIKKYFLENIEKQISEWNKNIDEEFSNRRYEISRFMEVAPTVDFKLSTLESLFSYSYIPNNKKLEFEKEVIATDDFNELNTLRAMHRALNEMLSLQNQTQPTDNKIEPNRPVDNNSNNNVEPNKPVEPTQPADDNVEPNKPVDNKAEENKPADNNSNNVEPNKPAEPTQPTDNNSNNEVQPIRPSENNSNENNNVEPNKPAEPTQPTDNNVEPNKPAENNSNNEVQPIRPSENNSNANNNAEENRPADNNTNNVVPTRPTQPNNNTNNVEPSRPNTTEENNTSNTTEEPNTPQVQENLAVVTKTLGNRAVEVAYDKTKVDADNVHLEKVEDAEVTKLILDKLGEDYKVLEVFEIHFEKDNKEVKSDVERTVSVSLVENNGKIEVYHIADNNELELVPSEVIANKVYFTTNHFSKFTIVQAKGEKSVNKENVVLGIEYKKEQKITKKQLPNTQADSNALAGATALTLLAGLLLATRRKER